MSGIHDLPRQPDGRLQVVDALRGFAIASLFIVHMLESYDLYWATPQPSKVAGTVFLLFMGKSFSLLALCFGFSFFVLIEGRGPGRQVPGLRFAWRMLILATIGFVHSLIYRGDIIMLLAGMGMLLLLVHHVRSNRLVLALAVFFFLQPVLWWHILYAAEGMEWSGWLPERAQDLGMSVYLHGNLSAVMSVNLWEGQISKWRFMFESGRVSQIIGLLLVGMVLGRIRFFARLDDFARARRIALMLAVAATLLLHAEHGPIVASFAKLNAGDTANDIFATIVDGWFDLAAATIWILAILMLWRSRLHRMLVPLVAVGRATLTLYIGQSLIFVPFFYSFGLGMHAVLSPAMRLIVGLAFVALQVGIANLWFARFLYGPLEWGWRALTFRRCDIPFRRPRHSTKGVRVTEAIEAA